MANCHRTDCQNARQAPCRVLALLVRQAYDVVLMPMMYYAEAYDAQEEELLVVLESAECHNEQFDAAQRTCQ